VSTHPIIEESILAAIVGTEPSAPRWAKKWGPAAPIFIS
jgi:hypothetical protein